MMTKMMPAKGGKRGTTLTLPADALNLAERIARSRQVTLSTVISEAFSGFSQGELSVLDGVMLEHVRKASRRR